MHTCPFHIGQLVTWIDQLPNEAWRHTITPGPMVVTDIEWHDEKPSALALLFGPKGMDFKPGWRITVEYDADSTNYYNPPLSLILNKKRLAETFHEMWLRTV